MRRSLIMGGILLATMQVTTLLAQAYTDDFSSLSEGWAQYKGVKVVDHALELSNDVNDSNAKGFACNTMQTFKNLDYSAENSLVKEGSPNGSSGLVFWAEGPEYFSFKISANGSFKLAHYQNDEFKPLVDWTPSKSIKTGVNVWNGLRVTTKGSHITCFVNGVEVANAESSPPSKGGIIGFLTDSGDIKSKSVFRFRNLKCVAN